MKYLTLVIIVRNTINVAVNTDVMRTELEKGTPCSVRTLRECIIKEEFMEENKLTTSGYKENHHKTFSASRVISTLGLNMHIWSNMHIGSNMFLKVLNVLKNTDINFDLVYNSTAMF